MTKRRPMPVWLDSLYDDVFARVVLDREAGEAELAFLHRALRLRSGCSVLDQGCGIGTISNALARQGIDTLGIDIAPLHVDRARAAAPDGPGRTEYVLADARDFRPAAPVDAAYSWWTSWGHADDDAGNLDMLRRAFEALRPGGVFALDFMNLPNLLREFRPELVTRRWVDGLSEVETRRACSLDLARGFLVNVWTFRLGDGREVSTRSEMRLYMPDTIAAMLRQAGFTDVQLAGGVEGEVLDLASRRLIAVATRPPASGGMGRGTRAS